MLLFEKGTRFGYARIFFAYNKRENKRMSFSAVWRSWSYLHDFRSITLRLRLSTDLPLSDDQFLRIQIKRAWRKPGSQTKVNSAAHYCLRRSGCHGHAWHGFRPMTLRLHLSMDLPLSDFCYRDYTLNAYLRPLHSCNVHLTKKSGCPGQIQCEGIRPVWC
jgi:hypothetical protein